MSESLKIITVYDHPLDFPNDFVARESFVTKEGIKSGGIIAKSKSIEGIRMQIPNGLYRIDRHPKDDPVIAEVWM